MSRPLSAETVTRAEAVAAAGAALAAGYEQLDSLPLAEAVERAWTPTGPSREELAERIRARRGRATVRSQISA